MGVIAPAVQKPSGSNARGDLVATLHKLMTDGSIDLGA
jgi:hypothetical protein